MSRSDRDDTRPGRPALDEVIEGEPTLAEALDVVAEGLAPEAPSARLRARLLEGVAEGTRFNGFRERLAELFDLPPSALDPFLTQLHAPAPDTWERTPIRGLTVIHLDGGPRYAEADCGFVRMEPGTRYPYHRHSGPEWALVLAGSCADSDGRELLPGDVVFMPPGSGHGLRAGAGGPLLFAVVQNGQEFGAGAAEE